MSGRQLVVVIAATTALALGLAWLIERAQVRAMMSEFEEWWRERNEQSGNPSAD